MVDTRRLVLFDDVFFNITNSGIARVWKSVLTELASSDLLASRDLKLMILNRSDALNDLDFESVLFPQYNFSHPAADREILSQVCMNYNASLFVSSYYTFALGRPSLMTVYDLIPEVFDFGRISRGWLERELAIMHASAYVAISTNTKNDLRKYYPFTDQNEVSVTHPGVDTTVFYRRSTDAIRQFKMKYALGNFLVFVGSRGHENTYKNGALLFQALREGPISNLDVVIVGGEKLSSEEIKICNENGVKLLRLELDDNDLAQCLSSAEVLLYPSLYEGFGLPPLEALAVGTPIITTDASSLPEATGALSLIISGQNTEEVREKVRQAKTSSWKEKIRTEGPTWAQNFTWKSMAESMVDAWAMCLSENPTVLMKEVDVFLTSYTGDVKNLQI
jgi:glycosyltransferase involved in cell wall biosynthesis